MILAEQLREARARIEVLEKTVEWRVEQMKKLKDENEDLRAALKDLAIRLRVTETVAQQLADKEGALRTGLQEIVMLRDESNWSQMYQLADAVDIARTALDEKQ